MARVRSVPCYSIKTFGILFGRKIQTHYVDHSEGRMEKKVNRVYEKHIKAY